MFERIQGQGAVFVSGVALDSAAGFVPGVAGWACFGSCVVLFELGAGWVGRFLKMGEPEGHPQSVYCHGPELQT